MDGVSIDRFVSIESSLMEHIYGHWLTSQIVRNIKKEEIAQKQADLEAARLSKLTDENAKTSSELANARSESRDLQAKLASAEGQAA